MQNEKMEDDNCDYDYDSNTIRHIADPDDASDRVMIRDSRFKLISQPEPCPIGFSFSQMGSSQADFSSFNFPQVHRRQRTSQWYCRRLSDDTTVPSKVQNVTMTTWLLFQDKERRNSL